MMRAAILAALVLASAPAHAQEADKRPTLWGDFKLGMTKAETKALFPKWRVVKLSDQCAALIKPTYDAKGGLIKITLAKDALPSNVDQSRCGKYVLDGLGTKYGDAARRVVLPYQAGPGAFQFLDTVAVFNSGALVVSFNSRDLAKDNYNIDWSAEYHLADLDPDTSAAAKL